MIVAVVDDLMMRSRISTAAKHAGVEVCFSASVDQTLASSADGATMILLDLNHRRVRPASLVETLKTTSGLAAVRVVGFVSHVDAAAIAEARQAGVAEVLARSAFVDLLPDLMQQSKPAPAEDGRSE